MGTTNSNAQFRTSWYSMAPPWLTCGQAEKYMYTMGLCTDILLDKMAQGTYLRVPGLGDPSQIPFLANDRLLLQGPDESNPAFIGRVQTSLWDWKRAGSRLAVLRELQYYIQGLQPGLAADLPMMTIIGGNSQWTTWSQLYQGSAIGAVPTLTRVASNWNWDTKYHNWQAWLVLYMYTLPTGQSGTSAQTGTATGTGWGQGHAINGVWVPNAQAPINTPFLPITGLTGITAKNVGNWITISGSGNAGNNGTFQIVQYINATQAIIANVNGVGGDAGPLTWSIAAYPWIAPGLAWGSGQAMGSPGQVFGQGELEPSLLSPATVPSIVTGLPVPNVDQGSRFGGVWQPSGTEGVTAPTVSWGLSCTSTLIATLRLLLQRWKSAGTWYPNMVIAFDGSTGQAGSAFSPNSTPGAGNADGTFGTEGKYNSSTGVWVPNRLVSSQADAWCQGTTQWPGGGAPVT